jgi:hypothetical protein
MSNRPLTPNVGIDRPLRAHRQLNWKTGDRL